MISACMVCMLMSCHVQVNRNHLREIADLTASLHLSNVPVSNVCCVHRYSTVQYSTVQYSTVQYSTVCVMCVCARVCMCVHVCVHVCVVQTNKRFFHAYTLCYSYTHFMQHKEDQGPEGVQDGLTYFPEWDRTRLDNSGKYNA